MTVHAADEELNGCYEMPTAVAHWKFLLERLPLWAKALHLDSKIDTTEPRRRSCGRPCSRKRTS